MSHETCEAMSRMLENAMRVFRYEGEVTGPVEADCTIALKAYTELSCVAREHEEMVVRIFAEFIKRQYRFKDRLEEKVLRKLLGRDYMPKPTG